MPSASENRQFLFSVIIPFHDQGEHLIDVVESCIRQTAGFSENIEVLLIDDGSNDISPYIGEIYAELYPENIRYRRIGPCPITDAEAAGIGMAHGQYRLVLNADDLLSEQTFERIRERLGKTNENTVFVLSPEHLENGEHFVLHPIQENNSETVIPAAELSQQLQGSGLRGTMFSACCVVPNSGAEITAYHFLPDAAIRFRNGRRDLSWDFLKYSAGTAQPPLYSKEQVREALFSKPGKTALHAAAPEKESFLFSIIMPVYKAEKYIDQAIRSILKQDIGFAENIQLILVDDGSPDSSGAICDRYRDQYPANITAVHQKNAGSSAARFEGTKYVCGRYVNFLDPDDYLSLDTLRRVYEFFTAEPETEIAVIPLFYVGARSGPHLNNERFRGKFRTADLFDEYTCGQTNLPCMFFRSSLLPYFSCDPGLTVSEDIKQAAALQIQRPRIGLVNGGSYYYRKFAEEKASQSGYLYGKPVFYTESVRKYCLETLTAARRHYGYIPRFIQYLVFSDLRYRLDSQESPEELLTSEELSMFRINTRIILSQIEREIIYTEKIPVPDSFRNACCLMKHNGVSDLYTDFVSHAPAEIWVNEVAEEAAYSVFCWMSAQYGRDELLRALRLHSTEMDPAGNPPLSTVPDYETLFGLHSADTAVRIWRNEIPEPFSAAAFEWMCSRYGEAEIVRSLHRLLTRLAEEELPLPDPIHNSFIGKIRGLIGKSLEAGILPTAAEYANNLFYYEHRILPKKIEVDSFGSGIIPKTGSAHSHLSFDPIILLESSPDLSDNTYALYREMLRQGVNEQYRLVWAVKNPKAFASVHEKNVSFTAQFSKEFTKIRAKAAAMVSCNAFICGYPAEGQISLFLTHGSPLKASPTYSYKTRFTHVLAQSEWLKSYVSYENDTPLKNLYVLGIPRNDALYHPNGALEKLGAAEYDRTVLWLPTYRKHITAEGTSNHIRKATALGIPALRSSDEAVRLNELLKKQNTLLILKPHPAQDLSQLRKIELSNFRILYNSDLERKGVLLYELLGAADAMITDYSSVYYDYLLTGNPIGLTMDDFDTYNGARGFVYQDPYQILKGHPIRTEEDIEAFLTDLSDGKDPWKEERQRVNALVNTWQDDQSSRRVCDFLLDLLKQSGSQIVR